MATKKTETKSNKANTNKLFKDAFIDKDKDFYKEVTINIDGEDVFLAKIRHLTQIEMASIAMDSRKNKEGFIEEDFADSIDPFDFSVNRASKSIVEWAFDEPITPSNVKYLSNKYSEIIFKAINELEEIWIKKSNK